MSGVRLIHTPLLTLSAVLHDRVPSLLSLCIGALIRAANTDDPYDIVTHNHEPPPPPDAVTSGRVTDPVTSESDDDEDEPGDARACGLTRAVSVRRRLRESSSLLTRAMCVLSHDVAEMVC